MSSSRVPVSISRHASVFGSAAACLYVAGIAIPFEWDIPLVLLALLGILATVFRPRSIPSGTSPLVLPVLILLVVTVLTILHSQDIHRSMRLSAPILPAALLFFLITEHFHRLRDIRLLCLTFCAVGLGLATGLIWTAWRAPWMSTYQWAISLGSPVFVVPNDATFLALLCPISAVLAFHAPRSKGAILAILAIGLTVCAICLLRSRAAMLTLIGSMTCAAALVRPRLALACGLATVACLLLVDACLDFRLLGKFRDPWHDEGISGRILLWSSAWGMFLEAPLLGHGPRTFTYAMTPWAHNLYLEALAEQGIVGLLALGFALVRGLASGWRITRHPDVETRMLGIASFSALVGFCIASALELSFIRQWVWIVLFTLLGIISRVARLQRDRPEGGMDRESNRRLVQASAI